MSPATYKCLHCGRDTFTSQRGLTQHQQRSVVCTNRIRMADIQNSGYHTANEGMLYTEINMTSTRNSRSIDKECYLPDFKYSNGGVPMLFDTSACETGHKPTKKAVVLTQKRVH